MKTDKVKKTLVELSKEGGRRLRHALQPEDVWTHDPLKKQDGGKWGRFEENWQTSKETIEFGMFLGETWMKFQSFSALRVLGGDVGKNVFFHTMKIRWHGSKNIFQRRQKIPRCARLGAMLRKMSISRDGQYVHMVGNVFSMIFKTSPRCSRFGAMFRHFQRKKYGGPILMNRSIFNAWNYVRLEILFIT